MQSTRFPETLSTDNSSNSGYLKLVLKRRKQGGEAIGETASDWLLVIFTSCVRLPGFSAMSGPAPSQPHHNRGRSSQKPGDCFSPRLSQAQDAVGQAGECVGVSGDGGFGFCTTNHFLFTSVLGGWGFSLTDPAWLSVCSNSLREFSEFLFWRLSKEPSVPYFAKGIIQDGV